MLFRQLFETQSSTFSYLLAEDYGKNALLIDPVLEQFDLYVQLIQELKLTLKYTLETHTHADHVTAAGKLRDKFNSQIVTNAHSQAEGVDIKLNDNDKLILDSLELTMLYTPGHTDDCCCYLMTDRVFTGDTLFIRSTGRTDFQSGNAIQQFNGITTKLLTLPDETLVYPAHDYKVLNVSTIVVQC